MDVFEITPNDISELSDTDLRSLVGLLCEEELRAAGLPTRSVSWGGSQDAPDGGIDVEVQLSSFNERLNFILRAHTGIQVKQTRMPPSKILDEMKPRERLRESIRRLITDKGCYIIASGRDDCTATRLSDRTGSMSEAVAGVDGSEDLALDFLDRNRLAAWVRCHPSMIAWVRQKAGRPLSGWRPFGSWASAGNEHTDEYLVDEEARLLDQSNSRKLAVGEGIRRLRRILATPKSTVRLAGLSGVGKTRLVQALFESGVGETALSPSLAIYSDIGTDPQPSARDLLERLVASGRRSILIADNCPPDAHRVLSEIARRQGSLVSLLTVEFDVTGDEPEETSVFRLEPSADILIERLLRRRYPYLGEIEARAIAGFAGGNARLGLALARTVRHGESLSDFTDRDLFLRLFEQRQGKDLRLLEAAEALSLVYSFDGETCDGPDSELGVLAALIGQSVGATYRACAELVRRDLVQKRGKWRAVLPQALANRLAKRALENMPWQSLQAMLVEGRRQRLLASFAHRLCYLHDSSVARSIASGWLGPGGILGDLSQLTPLGIKLLCHIAPVCPDKALESIERAAKGSSGGRFASRENPHFRRLTHLLASLAYDAALFGRAVRLLVVFARTESEDENRDPIRDLLRGLFQAVLSGTKAPLEDRASVIEDLVASQNPIDRRIGLQLLRAALEAWHFSSARQFEFGARKRDFGVSPRGRKEIRKWFSRFIQIGVRLVEEGDQQLADTARQHLAESFRGLWSKAQMFDELEDAAARIRARGPWREGWVAVQATLSFDSSEQPDSAGERLRRIAGALAPSGLLERARAYTFSRPWEIVDADDRRAGLAPHKAAASKVERIASEVAAVPEALEQLGSELVTASDGALREFGRGLALGAEEPIEVWGRLLREFRHAPSSVQNPSVLAGFLNGLSGRSPQRVEDLLDASIEDPSLLPVFPYLQAAVPAGDSGYRRLMQVLEHDVENIELYSLVGCGRWHESIGDDDLARLVEAIGRKPGGPSVAVDILRMRFHGSDPSSNARSARLERAGRKLLIDLVSGTGESTSRRLDYEVAKVAEFCLTAEAPAKEVVPLVRELNRKLVCGQYLDLDHRQTVAAVAKQRPREFLDEFLGQEPRFRYRFEYVFEESGSYHRNPLSVIGDDVLLAWCSEDPSVRFPRLAGAIDVFQSHRDGEASAGSPQISRTAEVLLARAPDPVAVVDEYVRRSTPSSWSGSLAPILAQNREALEAAKSEDPRVRERIKSAAAELARHEELERRREAERERNLDQRFE